MEFLDVPGASGAQYRFRRVALGELPFTAGNIVAVTGARTSRRFLLCATANDLTRAEAAIGEALRETRGANLFVRLNVARAVREAEHADIVAGVQPQTAFRDLD